MVEGFIYCIQLYPDRDVNLFKIGFSKNPGLRANKHRCLAPKLLVLRTWKADKKIEKQILNKARKLGLSYGGEVFNCSKKQILNLIESVMK